MHRRRQPSPALQLVTIRTPACTRSSRESHNQLMGNLDANTGSSTAFPAQTKQQLAVTAHHHHLCSFIPRPHDRLTLFTT
jgi:hypothetical protein